MDIAELMKNAREDPSLFSRINVTEILESLESVKTDFLENETFGTISENIFQSLIKLPITQTDIAEHCKKLVGYRYVDELHLLHKGKYVRWITYDEPNKIARGAVVVDIQFGDFGANILCRLMTGQFLRYRFDKCNTYQKLTDEEQLILMLYSKNSV